MAKKLFKWQQAELKRLKALTNEQLLEEALDSGCYSWLIDKRAVWTYNALYDELHKRLEKAKWI